MSMNSDPTQKTPARRLNRFFRKKRTDSDELNGFRVGDIVTDEPLLLSSEAAIAGNISAPLVQVSGTVFGSVTATTVQLTGTGQIWGDVFAAELLIEVGAKLYGWVSTFDAGTLELIRSGVLTASDVMAINIAAQTEDISDPNVKSQLLKKYTALDTNNGILHQLQIEGGANALSRKELEAVLDGFNRDASETTSTSGIKNRSSEQVQIGQAIWNESNVGQLQEELLNREAEIKKLERSLAEANRKIDALYLDGDEEDISWQEAEQYRRVLEERDLYKLRFEKLAYWVHENVEIPNSSSVY